MAVTLPDSPENNCNLKSNAKPMTLALTLLTLIHVAISLIGIASGAVVAFGFLADKDFKGWTTLFLSTTVATSVTGFFFPVHHFMPSHAVGIISLLVLALAIYARSSRHLQGRWRKTYVISSLAALYFNVFVAVVQSFAKIPALKELAPTQSETPFKLAQLVVLVLFVILGIVSAIRFRNEQAQTTSSLEYAQSRLQT
jgi:hypothetical protein